MASRVRALVALVAVTLLAGCLGDVMSSRGASGEAAIDVRGLRTRSQVGSGEEDVIRSARFVIYLVTGTTRRAVATRVLTAAELDAVDSEAGTTITMTFPYTSVDDKFEVQGWGLSADGVPLYEVGPIAFSMKEATSQGGQAKVTATAAPVYVGPGKTATKLVITPRTPTVSEGKTVTLTPTLYDGSGTALSSTTFRFHWWTSDNSVAFLTNDRSGVVTGGQRPGTTWIHAEFDDLPLQDSVLVANSVVPGQLRVTSGQNQSGPAGSALSQPIAVQVLTVSGMPLPGIAVGFAVTSGGGSVSAANRLTDTNGMASVTWTLGATIGAQQMTVSVAGLTPVVVSAVGMQTIPSSTRSSVSVLPTAILIGGEEAVVSVVLRDNNGTPMPNVTVTFSGSTALAFNPTSGVSDATGSVTTRVRASEAGTWSIFAMVGTQVIGSTAIAAGARQGVPATISIVSGDNQSVKVGQNFPAPLVVVVKDAAGKPVPGALVDWATAVGDGRMVTDANGQSSATYYLTSTWPLGPGTVTVTLTGYGATATFKYTAIP